MLEFEDDFEIPVDAPSKTVYPEQIANEQAFYTTETLKNPENFDTISSNLRTQGIDSFKEEADKVWKDHQEDLDNKVLISLIEDNGVSIEDKKNILAQHEAGSFKSTNLRDKFILEEASSTAQKAGKEDVPARLLDIEAQEAYIETVQARKDAHNELQRRKIQVAAARNASAGSVIGGILGDFLPLALPNFRSANAARKAGFGLDVEEIPALPENVDDPFADIKAFASGDKTPEEKKLPLATEKDYSDFITELGNSFLLTGSINQKIADAYRDAPPEQQRQIFEDVLAGIEQVPGTDFNKFVALEEILGQPLDSTGFVAGRNLLSLLEAMPLGQLITNPVAVIKWYTTFQATTKAAGAAKGAATFTNQAGDSFIPADTFLPNHNIITPAVKPKREANTTAESITPSKEVITLNDRMLKEEFPSLNPNVETTFKQPSTGYGRGNVSDKPPGSDGNILSAERVAQDLAEGQNYGQQQAARELLDLAKSIPTISDGKVFIDELWQAAGGNKVIPLSDFKEILKDLHIKKSITLAKSASAVSPAKNQAASLRGANDEEFNMLDIITPPKRTIDDVIDAFGDAGDDIAANDLINKILTEVTKIPESKLKDRVSKVYSSSFEDKQAGRSLVRVDASLFDKAFTTDKNYVGANGVGGSVKKYKDFENYFNTTKHIEVGSVKVDSKGNVSFIDGKHRYAVLRDKGLPEIPVSMDAESILNARNNGFLKGVMKEAKDVEAAVAGLSRAVMPSVNPNSPAGTSAMANPSKAAYRAIQVLADTSGELGIQLGASRAQLFGDWVLPKIDKTIEENFPNVAHDLRTLDDTFEKNFRDAATDPNITPVTEANKEIDLIVDTLREIKSATYQQSNSTIDFGRNSARGIAQFGRNDNMGWSSLEDAKFAYQQSISDFPNFPARIIQKDSQYFIEQEWEHKFNHLDRFFFGLHSLQSNFLGRDVSAVARSKFGDWVIPKTMSDSVDLTRTGGAMLNEVKANKIQQEFLRAIQQVVVAPGMPTKELNTALRKVQESQVWDSIGELSQANAHLSKDKLETLIRGYAAYNRLADYNYNWVNRIDRNKAEKAGHQGIYDENGQLVGLGTSKFPPSALDEVASVWSYEKNHPVAKPTSPEQGEVLLARSPIRGDDDIYEFVVIGGKYQKGMLPSRTLPKIEGWIPRNNVENWYVDATPRSGRVNGKTMEGKGLERFARTIGAGMTKPEALKLMEKLSVEGKFINHSLSIRPAKENMGNAGVDDYVHVARSVKSNKKRGERLITFNGVSRTEEPVQGLADSMRNAISVQVWSEYVDQFSTGFLKAFGDFTKGEFPTHASQIQAKPVMTELELKELKVAQVLFNQFSELRKFASSGDDVWSTFWHNAADVLENFKLGGDQLAELSRELAKQGNLGVRIPRTIATVMFIHTNPLRQLLIQPQQLMELNAILPEYLKQSALDIPAMITAMYSRAQMLPTNADKLLYNSAKGFSGMSGEEFDEVFEAFWQTGLPQAVDMNSMLLGMLNDAKFNLDPSDLEKALSVTRQVLKSPGALGKAIGFTPAELANITGTWLFTRQRFLKNNPGVQWNTPENLATISKQAWDISHSMIGASGAFPWQKGTLGTIMQFAAVQHKGTMQTLMSKTLSVEERVKLTAARLALYGAHGIPLGAVTIGIAVNQFGSDEAKDAYKKYEGGFIDVVPNTLVDIYMQDPKKKSDIELARALTPIPETSPFVEILVESKRLLFQEGGSPHPRLPAINALGSIGEAMAEIEDHYTVQDLDTKEKLAVALGEAVELFSGYNNYAKAKMIMTYRDKKNKHGQFLGLELNEADAIAQLFGFVTQQEIDGYLINNVLREREQFVSEAVDDIVSSMTKLDNSIGTADWKENKRRIQALVTAIDDDKDLINEIRLGVDRAIVAKAKSGSVRDNLYYKIYLNKAGVNSETRTKFMDFLRQNAESNPKDAETLRRIEEATNFTIEMK